MTKYEELCAAFVAGLPRKLALSKAVEGLPERMRTAITTELGAPLGRAEWLCRMYGRDVPYVFLARPVTDENGRRSWEPNVEKEPFFHDYDRIIHFGIGVHLVGDDLAPFTLYSAIAIEEISEEAFTLKIVNAPGTISIAIADPNSYSEAAQKIVDWMVALQSDPRAAIAERAPIGFR